MERIELDSLHRDLQLMTEFEAYYRQREEQRKRFKRQAAPVFARRPVLDPFSRPSTDISADELRRDLRAMLEPIRTTITAEAAEDPERAAAELEEMVRALGAAFELGIASATTDAHLGVDDIPDAA